MYLVCIKSQTYFLGKLGFALKLLCINKDYVCMYVCTLYVCMHVCIYVFLKVTRTYPKIQKSLKGSNNEQNVQSFQEKGDDVWNVGGIGG